MENSDFFLSGCAHSTSSFLVFFSFSKNFNVIACKYLVEKKSPFRRVQNLPPEEYYTYKNSWHATETEHNRMQVGVWGKYMAQVKLSRFIGSLRPQSTLLAKEV